MNSNHQHQINTNNSLLPSNKSKGLIKIANDIQFVEAILVPENREQDIPKSLN